MANIVLKLSGGISNTNPNASLGGVMSQDSQANITTSNTSLNNLFDDISKSENFNGTTDYRCVYISNDTINAGEIFASGEVYISGTPYADIQIGVGTKNATAPTIGDENTVPSGVSFSTPSSGSPLSLGADLDPGDYIALWIRRTASNISGTGTVTDSIPITVRGVE